MKLREGWIFLPRVHGFLGSGRHRGNFFQQDPEFKKAVPGLRQKKGKIENHHYDNNKNNKQQQQQQQQQQKQQRRQRQPKTATNRQCCMYKTMTNQWLIATIINIRCLNHNKMKLMNVLWYTELAFHQLVVSTMLCVFIFNPFGLRPELWVAMFAPWWPQLRRWIISIPIRAKKKNWVTIGRRIVPQVVPWLSCLPSIKIIKAFRGNVLVFSSWKEIPLPKQHI